MVFKKNCYIRLKTAQYSVYEDSTFETWTGEGNLDFRYIYRIYTGQECSDRSETIGNRQICFLRMDIDVQIFLRVRLSKNLEPFEILLMKK